MEREFLFPDIGSGLVEAEIIKWHVTVGQQVEVDQPLVEVETEKSVAEIPVPFSGTIVRLGVAEGEAIEVGGVLVVIETSEPADPGAPPPTQSPPATPPRTPTPTPSQATPGGGKAMPLVRKLAKGAGIDLVAIEGTGPQGSITRADVERAIASGQTEGGDLADDRRERMSKLRRTIAERMERAWREIPHISGHTEVAADRLLAVRADLSERHGISVPVETLVIKALIPALRGFPTVHGSVEGEELVLYERMDIGVAVDTPEGLIVPVIHGADRMPIPDMAARIRELAERAIERRLTQQEMSGNTFTVSNIGAFVSANTTQILPPNTTGIISLGRAVDRVIAQGPAFVPAKVMPLSVSVDHRAVDGGVAARFMAMLQGNLENPEPHLTD